MTAPRPALRIRPPRGSSGERLVVGAIELGGTHVASARVALGDRSTEAATLRRVRISPDAPRDELLAAIRGAALHARSADTRRWGVAVPGPFDYARGVARLRGVHKLEALYGVDLRAELADTLGLDDARQVRFVNDAAAFLLGEWWAGAAAGHDAAIGVTCGSGLGSAFLREGRLVESGPEVPPEARLDLLSYRGRPVEDTVSGRGLVAAYRDRGHEAADGADVASRARRGDPAAVATLRGFGEALGEVLSPWVAAFAPQFLVIGGSIAASFDLFGPALRAACEPSGRLDFIGVATRPEEAALLGTAFHAAGAVI